MNCIKRWNFLCGLLTVKFYHGTKLDECRILIGILDDAEMQKSKNLLLSSKMSSAIRVIRVAAPVAGRYVASRYDYRLTLKVVAFIFNFFFCILHFG
jgi:hypothetical protein